MLYTLLLILIGGMAYIRLAPDDPARWHRPSYGMSDPVFQPGHPSALPGGDPVTWLENGAEVRLSLAGADPVGLLADLDRVALGSPRTLRLAGSPAEGRITWITRSAFWGFPDYTTAEVRKDGAVTTLNIFARQRYGRGDLGVNAARLRDWLARLGAE